MQKNYFGIVALVVLVGVLVGGYFAYQYVKFHPPAFLIKLLTATKPPPPLPIGDAAPLTVPEGFSATIFARDVSGARVMTRDPKGTMLVSQTGEGKVVALPDLDSDGKADKVVTVLENLKQPHGIVVTCPSTGNASADLPDRQAGQDGCVLYVAETGELKVYTYDADTYTATYQKILTTFPTGSGHFTRTLLLEPSGTKLLAAIGSSCNSCEEEDARRARIQEIDLLSGAMTSFATGLRNSVFMAFHPVTGAVWATENSRDLIGDDIPPDEINVIEKGKDYGWPLCYGQNVHDTDFDKSTQNPCTDKTPARIDLQAHSAALGLAFVPEEGWPEEYWHDIIVAYHGSWNRSEPTGYKVVRFDFSNDGILLDQFPTDFITGFLPEGGDENSAIGRPVGVMAEPGGVVYISDDHAGAIYKIALTQEAM
ncbi:PQQ-dependent sugar dehydrogenase [Acetobacteraceae bacterium]|nr:PQQ-dependent sugar dehydrogenase [Candidatus Parcubacteria bacterium]